MDDALGNTELPYEGVTFTNKSKSDMINSLMLSFQKRDIKIPHWPEMIKELDSFEVSVNDIGTFKYAAAQGAHDDIVCSMFLAWSEVVQYAPNDMEVVSLDELQDMQIQDLLDFGDEPQDTFKNWQAINL